MIVNQNSYLPVSENPKEELKDYHYNIIDVSHFIDSYTQSSLYQKLLGLGFLIIILKKTKN